MEIKNIDEAKKYLNQSVFTATDEGNRGKYKVRQLYIGGVNLYYNQADYDVTGFYLFENKEMTKSWGDVEIKRIIEKFDASEDSGFVYFFSKEEAEKYTIWQQKDEIERAKEYDLKIAKELLAKHKVKYQFFD